MKIKLISQSNVLTILAAILLVFAASPIRAQIMGIGPIGSVATNFFDDQSSHNGSSSGGLYFSSANPWNGSTVGILQTDPTTGDFDTGSMNATFSGNSYSVSLNNVTLTQRPGNTGDAETDYQFDLHFLIGPGGLPMQPAMFPNFLVSGNVGTAAGSFASVSGSIYYYDSSDDLLDTVTYSWTDNTLGNVFNNVLVSGAATGTGMTAALAPNSDLYMFGFIDFQVDPGSISVETVPEASSSLLLGLAGVCGILWRRLVIK